MEIGQAVHASDLKLPRGVTLQVEPDTLVLHVIAQQAAEEAEAGEEAAEGAPEAPEAVAAPAGGNEAGEQAG
jgi:large subunit ribosomal protein L25